MTKRERREEVFTKAKVFCAVPGIGFPHSIPVAVPNVAFLKLDLKSGWEITVFDLTEPHSIVFTKNSFPEGGME